MIGRPLSEAEFDDALAYAIRKSDLQGNEPDYVQLLLPDVIQEREYEAESLAMYRASKIVEKEDELRWNLLGISPEQLRELRAIDPEMIALARSVGIA